jgi:hypothetical protein
MLTTYQMLRRGEPMGRATTRLEVVCSTLGESGAHKQIQEPLRSLTGSPKSLSAWTWQNLGIEAAGKIARFCQGRVYTMTMHYRVRASYLKAGKQREFITDYWNAAAYTPKQELLGLVTCHAGFVGNGAG